MSAQYWIAQYVADLFRNEPRNIGVVVELDGRLVSRFLAEREDGKIDGRGLRSIRRPRVYQQWVTFWRRELARSHPRALVELSGSHYRVIEGGGVDETEGDSPDQVLEYLYALLVSEGGFEQAMRPKNAVSSESAPALVDDVTEALLQLGLLQKDEELLVPHAIRSCVPITGQTGVEHKPAFVQENGHLCLIETVDFSVKQKRRSRDHAGWAAYMFRDVKGKSPNAEAVAVVRVSQEDEDDDAVRNGLALLKNEARLVRWLIQTERDRFLEARREMAFEQ